MKVGDTIHYHITGFDENIAYKILKIEAEIVTLEVLPNKYGIAGERYYTFKDLENFIIDDKGLACPGCSNRTLEKKNLAESCWECSTCGGRYFIIETTKPKGV